ncbi:MAG: hypothetical protein ACI88A_002742 [Paraglaciecola sp.]|jgi:hypothetical protein
MKRCIVSLIIMLSILSACSNTSRQIVGNKRTPIDSAEVQIYQIKPAEYEQIAFIQVSSKNSLAFSDQAMQKVIIERLKKEAAALGANGVLLTQTEEQVTGSIGSGTGMAGRNIGIGIGLSFPITNQLTRAVAIYVKPGVDESQAPTLDEDLESAKPVEPAEPSEPVSHEAAGSGVN